MQSGPALLHSNHQGQLSYSAQSKDVTIFPTPGMLQVRGKTGSAPMPPKPLLPLCPGGFGGQSSCTPAIRLLRGGKKPALLCVYVSWCGVGPALLCVCVSWYGMGPANSHAISHAIWASSPVPLPFLHLVTRASFLNNSKQEVGPALLSLHHLASGKGQHQCSNKAHR